MSNLIPVSRKEQYLSKIDGMTNKSPDKTYTKEEYFFSEILGEALHKPVLETRYEMYLAKIAGREIGIPYPETRLERFLAKAAGMNVTTPTPITREEIFWSNYSAIVDFEVEGVPPLTYKAVEGTLENYRIYGNTVGGESVGDKTGNLFDKNTIISNKVITEYGTVTDNINYFVSNFISVKAGDYTLSLTNPFTAGGSSNRALWFDVNKENPILVLDYYAVRPLEVIKTLSIQADGYIQLSCRKTDGNVMLNSGSTALPYEPYGYKVPVTVSNGTDTQTISIYIPEQIRKVGDEAEYISYADQKLHRIGAEDIDVTLPELPTLSGTNTLSVGAEVQPSHVFVEFYKEREYG